LESGEPSSDGMLAPHCFINSLLILSTHEYLVVFLCCSNGLMNYREGVNMARQAADAAEMFVSVKGMVELMFIHCWLLFL
jgi:hypothetical protein